MAASSCSYVIVNKCKSGLFTSYALRSNKNVSFRRFISSASRAQADKTEQKEEENVVAQSDKKSSKFNISRRPLSSLGVWNPFKPIWNLPRLRDVIEELYTGGQQQGRLPACDSTENEEKFKVRVELPGFSKDEIEVTLINNNVLVIKAEHEEEEEKEDEWGKSCDRYETHIGLPGEAEVEQIKAEYRDGVLYLSIPKKKDAPKKLIDVEVK